MKIPCKDCLVIPICRHKLYGVLMKDCEKLRVSIYKNVGMHPIHNRPMLLIGNRRDQTDQTLLNLKKILNPSDWFIGEAEDGRPKVMSRTHMEKLLA